MLGFACIYVIWGSTYLAIRFGVATIPPFLLAGVRFFIGGALFYLWAKIKGAPNPQKKHWLTAFIVGAFLVVGGNGLVNWSEKTLPSGIAALLVGMMPFFLVLFDWLRPRGNRPGWIVIMGLILGFSGVVLLVNPTQVQGVSSIDKFGAALILAATILWAFGSLYSRQAKQPESHALFAGMQMMAGGAVAFLVSYLMGEFHKFDISALSPLSFWSWTYLTLFGSFAFGVYLWLLQVSTPAKVSTYAYVNPVIAIFLGAMLDNEHLTRWTVGCSIIIISAVMVIITAKARAQSVNAEAISRPDEKKVPIAAESEKAVCECN